MSNYINAGKARAPYLLSSYGPGSIVNLGSYAIMPLAPELWGRALDEISAPLFKRTFNISRLVDLTKLAQDHSSVKTILFPDEFYCSRCGRIQRPTLEKVNDLRDLRCSDSSCGADLVVSRYVQYCHKGHIDRFDYRYFVHESSKCSQDMKIDVKDGAIASIIKCACGSEREIEFGAGSVHLKCFGRRPWLGDSEPCDQTARVSMRSSSDIYYAAPRSSIAIEPEADPEKRRVMEFLSQWPIDSLRQPFIINALEAAQRLMGISFEKRRKTLEFFIDSYQSDAVGAARRVIRDEFAAFCEHLGDEASDLWVEPQPIGNWLRQQGIDFVAAVRRLREVRAIVGFNRGGRAPDPAFDPASALDEPTAISKAGIALGYENRGEGIFIRFDGARLAEWAARNTVQARSQSFYDAEIRWRSDLSRSTGAAHRSIYILAHTFAHLLVRSISLYCGYSQSSLRERVLTSIGDEQPWAGILIYTSTSDSDGSLGGLVSIALDSKRFELIMRRSLTETSICSSDPICALDDPAQTTTMNGAACHACCIGPEPSCERGNRFLDRNLVTPRTLHENSAELCYFPAD